ncbi:high choriolytic enzyme 1-like isoform X2 [Patiria miniata]|uniref:Metalloendopeptidase n=1 Tax=Patiria miniata TaxID=46514 RepID=A0A914AZY0_PATMI|nr:high choriolytic enzyme 1-like isoform X2 [Patiria miniata]
MEPNVCTMRTAVCVLLLHVFAAVAYPVDSSDWHSGYSEASSHGSSDVLQSSTNQDTIEIAFEDTAFEEIKHWLVEGDIMTVHTHHGNTQASHDVNKRNALRDRSKRWPQGVVPYTIDDSYDATSRGKIVATFKIFHRNSCIRFVSRTNETDYIHILPKDGCWSYVGRSGGSQELSLNETCLSNQGTIAHELMHALGFGHEHNRPDRDEFVTIHWDNIKSGERHNFQKYDQSTLDHLNTTYDFRSVMHFNKKAFSKNDEPTIVPDPTDEIIGNREGLSATDKLELSRYYNCSCQDMDSRCRQWARSGSCETNRSYMFTYCQMSCRICGPGSGRRCMDKSDYCSLWKDQGHCETTRSMRRECKRTCGFCTSRRQE